MRVLGYVSALYCLMFLIFNYINVYKNTLLTKKNFHSALLFLVFSIIIIAAVTKPYEGDDLFRYNLEMNAIREKGLAYLFQYNYRFELITTFLILIATFLESVNLLSILSVTLFYGAIIAVLYKDDAFQKPSRYFSLFVILSASYQYLNELISGVRFPIAIALYLIILINDSGKKKRYYLLYILPILVHVFSILPVLIMLYGEIMQYIDTHYSKKLHWEYLVAVLPVLVVIISHTFTTELPSFFQLILEKIQTYSTPSFYLAYIDWRVQCCMCTLFIMFCIIFYVNGNEIKSNFSQKRYYLIKSIIILMAGLIPFPLIFNRLLSVYIAISFPLLYSIDTMNVKWGKIVITIFVILCLGLFCYRMVNAIHYWRFYHI